MRRFGAHMRGQPAEEWSERIPQACGEGGGGWWWRRTLRRLKFFAFCAVRTRAHSLFTHPHTFFFSPRPHLSPPLLRASPSPKSS